MGRVRAVSLGLVVAAITGGMAVAASTTLLRSGNVTVRAPAGWELVEPANDRDDPRTALVVGTEGAAPRHSACQVASYRVPAEGAVVVVLRWAGWAPDWIPTDRGVLDDLRLRREYFECWDGRGAAAQIAIRGRAFQLNVMVGDRASTKTVATALAVLRSVDIARQD